jgi:hypothetical protein
MVANSRVIKDCWAQLVQGGVCSNGTVFSNLNPYGFSSCKLNCLPPTEYPSQIKNYPNSLDIHSYYKCIDGTAYLIVSY